MLSIYNCKIIGVNKSLNDFEACIDVKLHFISRRKDGIYSFSREFRKAKKNENFKIIMHFAGVQKIKQLKGAVIREVVDEEGGFVGVGDPIKDELVLFNNIKKICSERELQADIPR